MDSYSTVLLNIDLYLEHLIYYHRLALVVLRSVHIQEEIYILV